MKYISLFSGIGGFEQAIHKIYPNAECLGYSEIKPAAITVYNHHYPTHKNLGDISKITTKTLKSLGKCDLLVGGFPCTNLSSMANFHGGNKGLEGDQSKLFYEMLRIIKITRPKYIIIENNASMSKSNQEIVTSELRKIKLHSSFSTHSSFSDTLVMTPLNAANFSAQTRKRLFWTNFPITPCTAGSFVAPVLDDILQPVEQIPKRYFISDLQINNTLNKIISNRSGPGKIIIAEKCTGAQETNHAKAPASPDAHSPHSVPCWTFKSIQKKPKQITRFQMGHHSDNGDIDHIPYTYPIGKSRPLCSTRGVVIHRIKDSDGKIGNKFYIRIFTIPERCRLFGFPENYVDCLSSENSKVNVLGNSVVVPLITHIVNCIP